VADVYSASGRIPAHPKKREGFVNQLAIEENQALVEARQLLSKSTFTHEDSARVDRLLRMAELTRSWSGNSTGSARKLELHNYGNKMRRNELRDLGASNAGAYLVPQVFAEYLKAALKMYDRLFDPDVSTEFETAVGGDCKIPAIDDTTSVATVIADFQPSVATDPLPESTLVPNPPVWRSGWVWLSRQLLVDMGFEPAEFLAPAFAARFGRGIGPTLVSALLSGAKVGATATGDPNKTGATGATSIGYQDLLALRKSVNPAYRATSKTYWLMNDDTLTAIDGLLDKNGRPIIKPHFDGNGNRLLLGYPVALCPSMPEIAANATPVAFGATGYFVLHTIAGGLGINANTESRGEQFMVGFQTYFRCAGTLLCASGADSPVKTLQNSAS
jgi:HK97 family phage major capsid protein